MNNLEAASRGAAALPAALCGAGASNPQPDPAALEADPAAGELGTSSSAVGAHASQREATPGVLPISSSQAASRAAQALEAARSEERRLGAHASHAGAPA